LAAVAHDHGYNTTPIWRISPATSVSPPSTPKRL
jgi:hypothetical protein